MYLYGKKRRGTAVDRFGYYQGASEIAMFVEKMSCVLRQPNYFVHVLVMMIPGYGGLGRKSACS